jgi:aspartyl-tRNA(Asn)/glutamyl-tRNA(Gln) amidotransferase subunit B
VTRVATDFETVIGLEVHVHLTTASKMFCGCSADYAGAEPNTHVCPVCLGMPGTLPVINERAIEYIVMAGLALNCEIAEFSKFDRKNYPYPDLMKGYQISQYDLPICRNGWLDLEVDGERRRVRIQRVHMEEDTAKLIHRQDPVTGERYSLIDVNRSGVPLVEIVSYPDIRSPAEARAYLVKLRQLLRYVGVSRANMEEGDFRCDANISLRPRGSEQLGAKVEIKNMNSFRAVFEALSFEERRQAELLAAGGSVVQETRGWDDERKVTVPQRTKEEASDYRYFPEPDLPPLRLSREWVEQIRQRLPELPDAKRARFTSYGLSEYEAALLSEERARADYFERLMAALEGEPARRAKVAANWMLGEVARWLNEREAEMEAFPVPPERLAELAMLVERGTITGQVAKKVFEEMAATGEAADAIVERAGLAQISAADELRGLVRKVIEANPKAVADYRAGKEAAVKFLIGQVMRETRGRANPQLVHELLTEELQ